MKLLTVKETARILNVSEKTLYQWSSSGKKFPFVRIGKILRVDEKGLFQFIQKNKSKQKEESNGEIQ